MHVVRHGSSKTWKQIRDELASQTTPRATPGTLPLADRVQIGSATGPQSYLPIDSARMANATAIVRQALSKHMGVRAAVIAVATAMQESGLENISYGDRDSLGLFQQRPSMGWGTAAQITTPSYAADAFLDALATHQKADPGWASEPLWATAQAVQKSGFPYRLREVGEAGRAAGHVHRDQAGLTPPCAPGLKTARVPAPWHSAPPRPGCPPPDRGGFPFHRPESARLGPGMARCAVETWTCRRS